VRRLGEGPPPVVGVVHVQLGIARQRIVLVSHGGVDDLEHEHTLAGMGGQGHEGVTELAAAGHRHRERHQRPTAGVAEQHDRFGAAPPGLLHHGLDVEGTLLVQAVGVVVDVAGSESEYGVAGCRQ